MDSEQKPVKTSDEGLSFMFESGYGLKTTKYAINEFLSLDQEYCESWKQLSTIKYE